MQKFQVQKKKAKTDRRTGYECNHVQVMKDHLLIL